VFLTEKRLDKAEDFVTRHGAVVVTFARFLEGLRQANGLIAGITEMPWLRFLTFNAVGAVLWVAVWASLGDLAGNHITAIYHDITKYSLYVLIVLVAAAAALVVRHLLHRRHGAATADASASPADTSHTGTSHTGSPHPGTPGPDGHGPDGHGPDGSGPVSSSPENSAATRSSPAGTGALNTGTSTTPRAAVSSSPPNPAEAARPAEAD